MRRGRTKQGQDDDRWEGLEELLETRTDLELADLYQCREGTIAGKRLAAGIKRAPHNGKTKRVGPSDEQCARWNEAAAQRRLAEIEAGDFGYGGSIAASCIDHGGEW